MSRVNYMLSYLSNKFYGSMAFIKKIERADSKKLVFSLIAGSYGDPEKLPMAEGVPLSTFNF